MSTNYKRDAADGSDTSKPGRQASSTIAPPLKRNFAAASFCVLAALLSAHVVPAWAADASAPAGAPPAPPPGPARAPAPPPSSAARIILLGTAGGPGVIRQRSEPANLFVVDGKPYLIDAGESVSRQIVLADFQLTQIHNIFITHHHADHNAGLPALLSLQWFGRSLGPPQPAEQIYGPPATEFLVNAAVEYLGVSERIFRAGIPEMLPSKGMFEAHDIDHDGAVYSDDKVKVTAAENTHFSFKSGSPETGQDRSYSYRFDTKYGSVVFTGDTGLTDALEKLARGADVLVSEVRAPGPSEQEMPVASTPPSTAMAALAYHIQHEHMTPEQVGKVAQAAHVKVVILTHVAPSTETDLGRFTAGVRKTFRGVVIPGKDFLEYDLD